MQAGDGASAYDRPLRKEAVHSSSHSEDRTHTRIDLRTLDFIAQINLKLVCAGAALVCVWGRSRNVMFLFRLNDSSNDVRCGHA